jgi:hypothetical protein
MTRNRISKRSERYVSYNVKQTPEGEYKISISYFIDDGNPIRNIDFQRIKYITCSGQDLDVKVKEIKDIINETRWRLIGALRNLGATESNIDAFIQQKIR